MNGQRPKVFAARIDKDLTNNNHFAITRSEEVVKQKKETINFEKSINQKLRDIFSSSKYVYKADVIITLKDKTITKKIIGRNKNQIITIDNELINIDDILDIEFAQ